MNLKLKKEKSGYVAYSGGKKYRYVSALSQQHFGGCLRAVAYVTAGEVDGIVMFVGNDTALGDSYKVIKKAMDNLGKDLFLFKFDKDYITEVNYALRYYGEFSINIRGD